MKLDQDTFIDGHGLHTTAQLLESWSHLQSHEAGALTIEPLFFFPDHVERNPEVIGQIVWTIEHQLRLQGDVRAVERFRQLIERELNAAEFHRRLRAQVLDEEYASLCSG